MLGRRRIEIGIVVLLPAAFVLPATAGAEPGVFVEPEVEVLQVFEGDRHGSLFGWAVSAVADVDGDGASEVLTGAPFNTLGGANAGRAYLFSGATGAPLFVWTGEAGDRLGFSIADAGDVDGDGTPDVIAGAPGGMDAPGTARIYSGATGDEIAVLSGSAAADNFGVSVTGVGDVDGDGLGDVLVGAPRDPTVGLDSGRVTLFAAADWSAPLWSREGEAGMRLGGGAGPIGDVNGDATADVVVGAHGNGGAVWVLAGDDGSDVHVPLLGDRDAVNLGQFFVAGVGDVDGDAVPDVYGGDFGDAALGPGTGRAYVWSGASGERLHTFAGTQAGEGLGCGRGAGDADGDGVPDIAVGSYSASPGGVAQAGFVTIFSGASGEVIRTITGTTELEQVGFDVVGLGDVNGDGRDDLVMSGANDDRVYVIAGVAEDPGGESSTGEEPGGSSSEGGGSTAAADGSSTTATSPPEPTTSGSEAEGGSGSGSSSASESSEATGQGSEDSGGCGCRASRSRGGLPWLLAALGLPWLRRRARAIEMRSSRAT